GFTTLAIVTLALGIGAVSTVFSLAYALWLQPLPYADPDALVWIHASTSSANAPGSGGTSASLTAAELTEYRRPSGSFDGIAGFMYSADIARVANEPVRVVAHFVTPNLFRVLGVKPAIGRDFTDNDADTHARVVMLSHATWLSRFGGDPNVTSKTLKLD